MAELAGPARHGGVPGSDDGAQPRAVDRRADDGDPVPLGPIGAPKRRRAAEFLEKVRIPDPEQRLSQYPHEFSGGMRQRVCIAMALLAEPDLLIADEPTTALDATLAVEVMEPLRALPREVGCAVVFISHHLGAVAELCEDVAVMYAGEVVEHGPVRASSPTRAILTPARPSRPHRDAHAPVADDSRRAGLVRIVRPVGRDACRLRAARGSAGGRSPARGKGRAGAFRGAMTRQQ